MTELGKNPADRPKGGIERRSRLFYTIGSCFVGAIFVFFTLFLVRHYFHNGLWVKHYYKDARVFANECSARFARSDDPAAAALASLPFKPIASVPHTRGFFSSWLPDHATGHLHHLEYLCTVSTDGLSIGRGVNYMHLGWIFGDDIRVSVNERQMLHIKGEDFVSFPVSYGDLSVPELTVRIQVTAADGHRMGLASLLPPAISTDSKTHTNLLGIQPIFELNNGIVPLIPSLCLGLLLALAWMTGVRTRIMFTGMFYFVAKIIDSSWVLIAPYLPVAAPRIHSLSLPLDYLTDIAVLCILLEVFGIWRTKIYSLMNIGAALSLATVCILLAWDGVFPYTRLVANYVDSVMVALCIVIVFAGWRARARTSDKQRRYLMTAALIFGAAFGWRFINELTRHYNWGGHVNVLFYFEFLIPLYLTGIVLYHLSAVELELRQAMREREVMKGRLQVGADLLAVVRASGGRSYRVAATEIEWTSEHPAGFWSHSWEAADGAVFVVFGNIIGGDEHVALGAAAISALLLPWKEQARGDGVECMSQINHTLFSTFRGYVRTSVTMIRVAETQADVWSAGCAVDGLALQAGDKRFEVSSGNQLSGTSGTSRVEYTRVDLPPGSRISVLIENEVAASLLPQVHAA